MNCKHCVNCLARILSRLLDQLTSSFVLCRTNRWGKETLEHYMKLFLSEDAERAGILLTSAYELFEKQKEDPSWKDIVPCFRHLTKDEIHFYDPSGRHIDGIAYDTIIACVT